MTSLIVLLCIILITVVLVQIGKVYELTNVIKGEQQVLRDNSKWNGWLSLVFLVVFLFGVIYSAWDFKNVMLGYGPHESASEHGLLLDNIFFITLVITGIVFVLTHIALFFFVYKYRYQEGRKAMFIPHDNRLEIWWTAIPAVVMTILVVRGLNAWNTVMADVKEGEEYMEIEATAQQFGWTLRYPGADGKIGARDYKLTTGANTLGVDFTDPKTWDDIIPGQELYLPVGKKVRVRILAKDVLHNFYLPQHRVKMDAIPGLPTYFVFTPSKTTSEYRNELRKYPEYNEPFDPADPTGPKRWEKFDYELACAELCGKGHYSMRRVLKIVTQEEYDAWLKQQKSFYLTEIRGKADDPNKDKVLDVEIRERAKEFGENIKKAVESTTSADKTLSLNHISFESGSATLTSTSKYELDNLVTGLNAFPNISIEISGHTDNNGEPAANLALSSSRAAAVAKYLADRGISAGRLKPRGYGDTKPLVPNDSPENMAKNRRTEFTILN
ncbi:MAG TPA: flagellar motor protein MotB [Saprospirales bacterium]|nr:flagellar motor protein MotB [Saprospirales bacterium]